MAGNSVDETYDSDCFMSDSEEDLLDTLLQGDLDHDVDCADDPDFTFSQSSSNTLQSQGSEISAFSLLDNDPLQSEIYWQDENVEDTMQPTLSSFSPSRPCGLQLGRFTRTLRSKLKEPVDFFKLFLTLEIVAQMCICTNAFAEKMIQTGSHLTYTTNGQWDPVTVEELYRFFGILIYMSVNKLPTIDRYWSKDNIYNSCVSNIMTRDRFKALLAFIQVTPPIDIDKEKKLTQIQPLLTHVIKISQDLYQPYQTISADERMVASKHQFSGIRQYMKDKPVRFGLKLFVLACSQSGYTFDFFVYLGKKHTSFDNTNTLSYNVIMNLIPKFLHQGYYLFIDSFFMSLQLARDLLYKGIYVIGTVRMNSSAMPDCLKDVKLWEKRALRGDIRWVRDGHFVVVQWKDCKTVSVLSAVHKGSDVTECKRTLCERTGWKRKRVCQPKAISDYNKSMGGVDLSDQQIGKYPCYIRTQLHWWKVLFFHCLDIMIVNSFIIFKEFVKSFPNDICLPSHFGQLEYRECIVKSLCCLNKFSSYENNKSCCVPEFSDNRSNCRYCQAYARINDLSAPSTKSFVFCATCNVYLCLSKDRNCFLNWHSANGRDVRNWHYKNCKK